MAELALGHASEQVTGLDPGAHLNHRLERPFLLLVDTVNGQTPWQEVTVLTGNQLQRILQTVIHLPQQPRPQCHGQHLPGLLHGIANGHATGGLEYLHIGLTVAHAQHLRLQLFAAPRVAAPRADQHYFVFGQRVKLAFRITQHADTDNIIMHAGYTCGHGIR